MTKKNMGSINDKLSEIEGFLLSINRNMIDGWYEIKIGLHKDWVYSDNDEIECVVVDKTDNGDVLLNVKPKAEGVIIDDLITFIQTIIKTNEFIAEEEKRFKEELEMIAGGLETKTKEFYKKLNTFKEDAFKKQKDALNVEKVTENKPTKKISIRKEQKADDDKLKIDESDVVDEKDK